MKRLQHAALAVLTAIVICPVPSPAALTKTCLTGTAPDVVNDASQIRAVRALIDGACVCSDFDGSKGKAHRDYVKCARAIIKAQVPAALRSQCVGTIKSFYARSACGRNPAVHASPCIQTVLKTGKITCTIKPTTKKDGVTPTNACVDTPGKVTRVACSGYTRCIDAADSSGNIIIAAPGDNGTCAPSDSLVLGSIALFSWQNGDTISTVASDGSGEIVSLEWIPAGGFVELVVTFPGLLPLNALQLEGAPPSLQGANIVAGVIVGLNAGPAAVSSATDLSLIPRTAGGNLAGCDSDAKLLTCLDHGACCDDHDACIDVYCAGPKPDSGDARNCWRAKDENSTCVYLCKLRVPPVATCQQDCDVKYPACSPVCQKCHDVVVNCFWGAAPGPAKCCSDGDCGKLQQCIVNGKVITDSCKCATPVTPCLCDDGISCTRDEVVPGVGCTHTPDNSLCANQDDSDADCLRENCSEAFGCSLAHEPGGSACRNGCADSQCSIFGVCQGGTPNDANCGNQDNSDPDCGRQQCAQGALGDFQCIDVSEPAGSACRNGCADSQCTSGGVCQGGTPNDANCGNQDDSDADCTRPYCLRIDVGVFQCHDTHEPIGSPCKTGSVCTTGDVCSIVGPGVGCTGTADSNLCNTAPRDNDPDADCRWNICEVTDAPGSGGHWCTPDGFESVGSPCDDANPCTTGDSCQFVSTFGFTGCKGTSIPNCP